MASVSSHLFAAGDIDYINNLNLVRTDIGGLVTEANAKGTMSTQNANAVAITGGSFSSLGTSYLNGNLGVGVSSPDALFHVGGAGPVASFCGTTGASYTLFGNKDSGGASGPCVIWSSNRSLNFSRGTLFTGTGGTLTTDMYIDNTGIVNITSNLRPNTNGTIPCGGTSNRWSNVYSVSGSFSDTVSVDGALTCNSVVNVSGAVSASNILKVAGAADNGVDKIIVNGGTTAAGRVVSTSATAGVGYATGAGGAVTQTGTFNNSVTLNKISGEITTISGVIGGSAMELFPLSNSTIGADDVVIAVMTSKGTAPTPLNISATCQNITAGGGSCTIMLQNRSAIALPSGTYVINFCVIKAVKS